MTCLMWAAYNNSPEVVKVLLDRGAEVDEKDVDGLTALHWWVGTVTEGEGLQQGTLLT